MVAGTPDPLDSYWLSQSAVFRERVETQLVQYLETVQNTVPTGATGAEPTVTHQSRTSFVKQILAPGAFASWLNQFAMEAAADGNLINAATQAATNYTPITSAAGGDTAAAAGGPVTPTLISNAIAAAFNANVPGL